MPIMYLTQHPLSLFLFRVASICKVIAMRGVRRVRIQRGVVPGIIGGPRAAGFDDSGIPESLA